MMDQNIVIDRPQEVKEKISAEAALLRQYHEGLAFEAGSLSGLEGLISETSMIVDGRRRRLYAAIEELRQQAFSWEDREALEGYRQKLAIVEEQVRIVNECYESYQTICSDMSSNLRKCASLSESGSVLATRLERLLDRIIEAR